MKFIPILLLALNLAANGATRPKIAPKPEKADLPLPAHIEQPQAALEPSKADILKMLDEMGDLADRQKELNEESQSEIAKLTSANSEATTATTNAKAETKKVQDAMDEMRLYAEQEHNRADTEKVRADKLDKAYNRVTWPLAFCAAVAVGLFVLKFTEKMVNPAIAFGVPLAAGIAALTLCKTFIHIYAFHK